MRRSLDDQVALVSVVHVPSGCGIVHPIEAIGEVLRGGRAVYAVDACQSVGQVEIDVRRAGCDLLTAAGRKFLAGPRGTGFAVVREALRRRIVLPLDDLQAAMFEAREGSYDEAIASFIENNPERVEYWVTGEIGGV